MGIFSANLCILSSFVTTHVYALLYWAFSHRFTHNLVAFCRKRRLRAFVNILAGSLFFLVGRLFSFPCLSQILSSTPVIIIDLLISGSVTLEWRSTWSPMTIGLLCTGENLIYFWRIWMIFGGNHKFVLWELPLIWATSVSLTLENFERVILFLLF